ncbi:hypothetical protein M501DRAFT_716564 [Patellaria atrata CBS 101060]|uniref:Uncharacterized protein n=1 Tax=Patellaria atrata CBS 101060 TaxID=1346257 RepID=A0A9P4S2R8_9PEZI|nr:hypothetical protein M501DRAFT_716564 [Patellaria atrata CBS 101060]
MDPGVESSTGSKGKGKMHRRRSTLEVVDQQITDDILEADLQNLLRGIPGMIEEGKPLRCTAITDDRNADTIDGAKEWVAENLDQFVTEYLHTRAKLMAREIQLGKMANLINEMAPDLQLKLQVCQANEEAMERLQDEIDDLKGQTKQSKLDRRSVRFDDESDDEEPLAPRSRNDRAGTVDSTGSFRSRGDDKIKKFPDPPELTDGKKPTYKEWKSKINDKLHVNSD